MGCAPSDVEEEAFGRDVRRGETASLCLSVDDREVGVLLRNVASEPFQRDLGKDATRPPTTRARSGRDEPAGGDAWQHPIRSVLRRQSLCAGEEG